MGKIGATPSKLQYTITVWYVRCFESNVYCTFRDDKPLGQISTVNAIAPSTPRTSKTPLGCSMCSSNSKPDRTITTLSFTRTLPSTRQRTHAATHAGHRGGVSSIRPTFGRQVNRVNLIRASRNGGWLCYLLPLLQKQWTWRHPISSQYTLMVREVKRNYSTVYVSTGVISSGQLVR